MKMIRPVSDLRNNFADIDVYKRQTVLSWLVWRSCNSLMNNDFHSNSILGRFSWFF